MNAAYPLIKTNQRDKTMKQGLNLRHTPLCHHVQLFTISYGVSTALDRFSEQNWYQPFIIFFHFINYHYTFCLFVYSVALRPKSTAMVIAGRSVRLTTLFPGQA